MDLDHTSRECKGHLRHTTTPTKPLPYLLGALLRILLGPHLLLGPIHLNIMPNQPLIHSTPILSHNLSGMHLIRGGGPNTTLFPLFCLHHLPNHNPIRIHLKTQLPVPPFPQPYHGAAQPNCKVEAQHVQMTPLELNDLHHSSRRVLQNKDYINIIE